MNPVKKQELLILQLRFIYTNPASKIVLYLMKFFYFIYLLIWVKFFVGFIYEIILKKFVFVFFSACFILASSLGQWSIFFEFNKCLGFV
jgi:hypothetical protein